jgi:hypothetical protein
LIIAFFPLLLETCIQPAMDRVLLENYHDFKMLFFVPPKKILRQLAKNAADVDM